MCSEQCNANQTAEFTSVHDSIRGKTRLNAIGICRANPNAKLAWMPDSVIKLAPTRPSSESCKTNPTAILASTRDRILDIIVMPHGRENLPDERIDQNGVMPPIRLRVRQSLGSQRCGRDTRPSKYQIARRRKCTHLRRRPSAVHRFHPGGQQTTYPRSSSISCNAPACG